LPKVHAPFFVGWDFVCHFVIAVNGKNKQNGTQPRLWKSGSGQRRIAQLYTNFALKKPARVEM